MCKSCGFLISCHLLQLVDVELITFHSCSFLLHMHSRAVSLPNKSQENKMADSYLCLCQVFGDEDDDGFYHGESGGLSGAVTSNMVSVIPVDDDFLKHQLIQQGFLPVDHTCTDPSEESSVLDDLVVRRMVAIFEYDPWESSPNMDSEMSVEPPHGCPNPL
ncbi:RIMS-binding protein 2-like [Salmo trutta]|uniref:RIMS-binding protein 2-like n=1 Tax=Salmo trutta TaxID=8032 RepID=UPI0011320BB8|nr:RIMS-binding protein 2-like [Salmo trutta]